MSLDPELRKLLGPMIDRDVELTSDAFRVDRARVLAGMAKAGARPWRRPVRALAFGLAFATVALVALVAGLRHRAPQPLAPSLEVFVSAGNVAHLDGATRVAVPSGSTRVEAAGELETAEASGARVRVADGTEIELGARTRVGLGELPAGHGRVRLVSGSIRCTVPHRPDARRFEVVASDVTVVDLGTIFTVAVDGAGGATRVAVEQGEVLVRRGPEETHVRAPGTWSSVAVPPAPPAPAPRPAPKPSLSRAPHAEPEGTLAVEAQLLREGLAAERQGRPADARSAFSRLLAQFPRSPLAGDARAALARVEAAARP